MSLSPAAAKGEIAIGKEELGESSPRSSSTRNSPATPRSRPVVFRGTLFQILLVGFCTFCAPGIWSAMNGLGLTNIIGLRLTLALGFIGYPLYAAGLYVNNRFDTTWFVYFGTVACGISAGFFWSVEGAIATGYPGQHKRGRYIAAWFTFRNLATS
ncbi:hypothetical protein MPDQ_006681 [Monascus purpureus]|uniref:Uncharacterized protein n=1 Tax=Monascus purpureus TaxID=5098 RepID=A0A507QYB3_MONPU|nr:hypothetical protein MPDQ_006681 [Monascus purpureus]